MKPLRAIVVVLCVAASLAEGAGEGRELAIRRLLGCGRFDEAFMRTREIIDTMPDRSVYYDLLAEAGHYAGRGGEADSILGACVRRGWDVGDAVAAMAWLDVHRARWLDAYTHFQTSIEYGGNSFRAYAGIQEMHEKLHGRDAAISHLLALTHTHDRSGPVWYALALAYWGQWDLTKALFAAEQALRSSPPDARVRYLHLAIRCAIDPGKPNRVQVDNAYRDAHRRGDREGMAFLQWVRMNALLVSASPDSAEAICREGFALAKELGMLGWQGQFLLQRGRNALGRGDIPGAIAATDSAAGLFRRAGAHDGILAAYSLRLNLLLESFHYAEALDYCSRMLLQLDDRADPRIHAGAAIDAAWILSKIGGQRIAIVLGIHAESTLENMLYASHDRCRLNTTLSSIHASLGDTVLALRYGRTAMRFARSAEDNEELIGNCEGVLGEIHLQRGDLSTARAHFARQWARARQCQDPGEQRAAAMAMARTFDVGRETEDAQHWVSIALRYAMQTDDRHSEMEGRLLQGRIAAVRGDSARALKEYTRAYVCIASVRRLRFLCSLTREMREWYLDQHAGIADALMDIGEVRTAAAVLARARRDVLFPVTSSTPGMAGMDRDDRLRLDRSRRATAALVHRSILRGSLEDVAYSDSAFRSLCTFFSHSLPAFMRIDDEGRQEQMEVKLADRAGECPNAGVDRDEVAVEFVFGADHTKVIAMTRDTVAFCRLSADRTAVTAFARDIVNGQEGRTPGVTTGATLGTRARIFDPLVKMVESIAGGRHHLAIIGDGPHTMIPFEVLTIHRGIEARPLVDRFAVSYRPWLNSERRGEWMDRTHNGRVLMVGDAEIHVNVDPGPAAHGGLPAETRQVSGMLQPLPGTIKEISLIEEHFGSHVDVLRGDQATDARFCAMAPDYGIVHLSTHGAARASGRKAHVLYLSPSAGSEGEVSLEDILSMEMKGSLVVLPVCYAGQASLTDDVESLAHAFLEAGAGSVLAARWNVDDDLAVEFLSAFYAALSRRETKSAAVRTAMHEMIGRGHHSYRVWAGFQLFGDGGALTVPGSAGEPGGRRGWMLPVGIVTAVSIGLGYIWRKWRLRPASHPDDERCD